MSAPNVDDPLDQKVADHWKNNLDEAIQVAKEWTLKYANNWVWLKPIKMKDKWSG